MIVGLTGTIASGKGKVAAYLVRRGFFHHSFSAEIRAIAKERKIPVNRANLCRLGNRLSEESPQVSILATRVIDHLKCDLQKHGAVASSINFVVDGIRTVQQINAIRKFASANRIRFLMIGIAAPIALRYQRLRKRKRHGDPKTFASFKKIDESEILGKGGKGQQIAQTLYVCDYIIENTGTVKDLEKKVAFIITSQRDGRAAQ